MKRKLMLLVTSFVLIIVSIFFVGCSKVNYTSGKDINDNIVEQVSAKIDESNFIGTDLLIRKSQISNIAKNTLQTKLNDYNSKVNSMIVEAHLQGETEKEIKYKQLLKEITVSEPEWDGNTFYVNASFQSESAYLIFYGLSERNFKEKYTTEQWLYNTIHYKGSLGYYQNYGLYNTLKRDIQFVFPEFTSEDTTLTYSYLTQSRRYHSNADTKVHTQDGYLHTWKVDNINQEIEFTLKIANRQNWYILAILIGFSFTLILSIVALILVIIKRHKNKRLIYRILQS